MDPQVSIIIPCLNERDTIAQLLDAVIAQSYPADAMEVVIADGGSTDGTLQAIADWQKKNPNLAVKLVENPKRIIPAALNAAIEPPAARSSSVWTHTQNPIRITS